MDFNYCFVVSVFNVKVKHDNEIILKTETSINKMKISLLFPKLDKWHEGTNKGNFNR